MSGLHWFEAYGVEIEYMVVGQEDLKVRPIADLVLTQLSGEITEEVSMGEVAWSNELVLHVLELKGDGPKADLKALELEFVKAVQAQNRLLAQQGAKLLPTAMHPLMEPLSETRLWPHGNRDIYQAYDRLFGCHGHGWSNLQSVHINLPFQGEREFHRLHQSIRLVLPLLPALAASSPLEEGRLTGWLDNRLEHYRNNQTKIPSLTGLVIPEEVSGVADYQEKILKRMYRDLAPYDQEGILCEEWVNSRGAIARFDRGAIEIRLLDSQECPAADLAMVALVVSLVQDLSERELPTGLTEQELLPILLATMQEGGEAWVDHPRYLEALGLPPQGVKAQKLWEQLFQGLLGRGYCLDPFAKTLEKMLSLGTLAHRITQAVGPDPGPGRILEVYHRLGQCLEENRLYEPFA